MASTSFALTLERVTKRFSTPESDLVVAHEISLSLEAGGRAAIVGPSGSGKTTVLGIAAGLDRPTEGTVFLCGRDLSRMSEDEIAVLRRDSVGFVFQSFHLVPTLTALENVLLPLELGGRRDRERARALLSSLGLSHRERHYPSQLSGGEQQRVALARAFVNEPTILFADEPTGNLDQANAGAAVDEMLRLNEEHGTALLLVTHDGELAARMGRVVRLRGGRVEEAA